jgi:hypothetical protein
MRAPLVVVTHAAHCDLYTWSTRGTFGNQSQRPLSRSSQISGARRSRCVARALKNLLQLCVTSSIYLHTHTHARAHIDRLLSDDFADDIGIILGSLPTSSARQTLYFSATMTTALDRLLQVTDTPPFRFDQSPSYVQQYIYIFICLCVCARAF